jgi:hypothetical protein
MEMIRIRLFGARGILWGLVGENMCCEHGERTGELAGGGR